VRPRLLVSLPTYELGNVVDQEEEVAFDGAGIIHST
jgi:hypothetical protein